MAERRKPSFNYPSLFEVEKAAASCRGLHSLRDVFPSLRYRFLFDKFKSKALYNHSIRVLPDDKIEASARVDALGRVLYLKASIHSLGLKGDAHAYMVLLHEAVHVLQRHLGIRDKNQQIDIRALPSDEKRDEWVTNRIAGAIAMPFDEAVSKRCTTVQDLMRTFNVTKVAAQIRLGQIEEMKRASARTKDDDVRFWQHVADYQKRTKTTLSISAKLPITGAIAYMRHPCPCGGTTCICDGKTFKCGRCELDVEPENVLRVRPNDHQ